jgi:hypothetical protein
MLCLNYLMFTLFHHFRSWYHRLPHHLCKLLLCDLIPLATHGIKNLRNHILNNYKNFILNAATVTNLYNSQNVSIKMVNLSHKYFQKNNIQRFYIFCTKNWRIFKQANCVAHKLFPQIFLGKSRRIVNINHAYLQENVQNFKDFLLFYIIFWKFLSS